MKYKSWQKILNFWYTIDKEFKENEKFHFKKFRENETIFKGS
jgi:hypothetical protein